MSNMHGHNILLSTKYYKQKYFYKQQKKDNLFITQVDYLTNHIQLF